MYIYQSKQKVLTRFVIIQSVVFIVPPDNRSDLIVIFEDIKIVSFL